MSMREKPILFNTDMVHAILDGRKTVTRRVAKGVYPYSEYGDFTTIIKGEMTGPISMENVIKIKSPYKLGDILYVRETWAFQSCIECINQLEDESCMDGKAPTIYEDKNEETEGCYIYRADHPYPERITWHPSIHMPKEAARIWLKVTNVRVERLQDMNTGDFLAEGVVIRPDNAFMQAQTDFIDIWESAIKKSEIDRYGWEANPWVWVIEFERIAPPVSI